MSIPRPEHPRPDRFRSDWLNLNGKWDFKFDPGKSGFEQNWHIDGDFDKEINVPFCMESELSGIGYKDFMPAVWYRRSVSLPESWDSKRVLFHVGACDYLSRVYVNGKFVGKHHGGYVAFSFDITDYLKSGENVIVVEAQDDGRSLRQPVGKQSLKFNSWGCRYTRTTGIWQTVWLEAVPKTYIDNFKVCPDLDNSKVEITVFPGGDACDCDLDIIVKTEGRSVASGNAKLASNAVTVSIDIPEAKSWSPESPFLYDLEFQLRSTDGEDVVSSYFGLRKIHFDGRKVYLNNEVLYQRTVLDQGFYPDGIYTAPTDEALKKDIELSMAVGFNGARLHEKIFEPRFLYWADKLGYLVWGEHGNWGLNKNDPFAVANFIDEWIEALDRDYNHPSIIGWCPLNETNHDIGELAAWFHKHLYQLTKTIDPNRLAIDASGYIHYEDVGSDLYDVHNYNLPDKLIEMFEPLLRGKWDEAFKNFPQDVSYDGSKPYFVSEFGGIAWKPGSGEKDWGYNGMPKTEEEFFDRYEKTLNALLDNKEICGWCYTQLYDIELEVNGLYYYDRTPKFSPEKMAELRRINSSPAKHLE